MTVIDKQAAPTKFLWMDLEMTGLNPTEDVILEVCAIVTDVEFSTLAIYDAIVHHPGTVVADRMAQNTWWQDYPANRDEFIRKTAEGTPAKRVETELIAFLAGQFGSEPAVLAGNSIHNDRNFIKHWWPEFDRKLHYRMLDVSAWKVVMQSRYGVQFEKQNIHRALDDTQASIAELQYYLEWFKKGDSL